MGKKKKRYILRTIFPILVIAIGFSVFTVSVLFAISVYNDEDFFESLTSRGGWLTWRASTVVEVGHVYEPEYTLSYNGIYVPSELPYEAPPEMEPEPTEIVPEPIIFHINHPFAAFQEACFTAQIMENFAPGPITTYYICEDGWALIYTTHGGGWVNTAQDKIYTSQVLGLFEEIDGYIVEWMHPQLIQIHQRYGDWLQIERDGRPMWLNPYFQPPIHLLEEFMEQFGDVSVFYENLASGFTFGHNANQVYFGASATKQPFGLYIFKRIEQGYASMADVHTFTAEDYWQGSGVIRHRYEYGARFSNERLLFLMLSPSDNIATRILRRVHGLAGYRQFIESIGANPDHVQNLTYSYLTAYDAGIFMRETYRYITSNSTYSQLLKSMMLANRYPFVTSCYPVASKSGWAANFGAAWHDMAVVFAPSPYTLSLLSSRPGHAPDRRVYDSISRFVQEFNANWFYVG